MPLPYIGVCGRRECTEICNCPWRSLPVMGTPHRYGGRAANDCAVTAATDAIGFYVIIGSLYGLQVPSRDCHVGLRPPRNDNSGAFTILTMACTSREYRAGRGMPLPYNGVYNRREYPEICSCQWRSLPVKGTPHP